ncbi:sodium transport system permease protein [Lishizhenia tianjinensis]|uniref:Sodium transport system permease protein n=1 Tax=Lishizhenia tianjinensis TaxID=477690 RepID=A0A1I7BKK2_9FLAO|nr:ABC transporter permease [Lishizhenia tianjinensis]SFT87708.1 sodium transport system permease protein [Lishizhenia tianjinensis]
MINKIFLKELKDTLRDRRTLMTMIVIPLLIFPIILNVFTGVSESFQQEAASKTLNIAVIGNGSDSYFAKQLEKVPNVQGDKQLVYMADTVGLKNLIKKDSIQLAVEAPLDFEKAPKNGEMKTIKLYFNATDLGYKERAEYYMEAIKAEVKGERLDDLQISATSVDPVNIDYVNIASTKEVLGKLVGGVLPYLFIAFGFIGCMYPAIDLFTGEKERGTIETLLTTPVARYKILIGKMGVVVLSGLAASTFALVGLYLSFEVFDMAEDPRIIEVVHSILSPGFIAMLYVLLIPLTIFFAGVMIPICVYAKSFKEAQSIITPLNIVIVLPAMVGFFPGIELDYTTAMIPVVNVVLATKELIAGTLDPVLLALSFGVMLTLAAIAVGVSYKQFDKEGNVVL